MIVSESPDQLYYDLRRFFIRGSLPDCAVLVPKFLLCVYEMSERPDNACRCLESAKRQPMCSPCSYVDRNIAKSLSFCAFQGVCRCGVHETMFSKASFGHCTRSLIQSMCWKALGRVMVPDEGFQRIHRGYRATLRKRTGGLPCTCILTRTRRTMPKESFSSFNASTAFCQTLKSVRLLCLVHM